MSSGELAGGGPAFYPLAAMTESGKSGDPKRSERLKAALRENLKRRKAQERSRAQAGGPRAEADDSSARPGKTGDPRPARR